MKIKEKKLVKSTTKINVTIYSQFALPMQKIEKTCNANAKNRKKLALLKQKIKKIAFPMEKKIAFPMEKRKICIPNDKNEKMHTQCQK